MEADLSGDYEDLEMLAGDWLSDQADLAANINADSVDGFKDRAILADEWRNEQQWPES